jgi:drug/metabolite transporter (DMT)-like permease
MSGTAIGILLVIVCASLEGIGQAFLKKSVLTRVRWFIWISIGVAILAVESLIYTEALKLLNVSVAFTISSLNLIAVALLSQWILQEHVTRTRWIGVALIFAGAALVMARTA